MIRFRQVPAGEIIIREDDIGETAYIIQSGRVEITKAHEGETTHLAYLSAGQVFGEMGMIDEKPRSATVTAIEPTAIQELHRDDFFQSLQSDPKGALTLLRVIFERLREADATILRLQTSHHVSAVVSPATPSVPTTPPIEDNVRVMLEGLTPQAREALSDSPYPITKFPFLIGRQSRDPLTHNDLAIPDAEPFQISRHHIGLTKDRGRITISDRGSRLGSIVDGRQLGGMKGEPGPMSLSGPEGTIVLGTKNSVFQFKVVIQ